MERILVGIAVVLLGIAFILLGDVSGDAIMALIGALQTFTQGYVMTNGGPENASNFYMLYLYDNAFNYNRMGLACAQSWILFLVIALLTGFLFRTSGWVYYGGDAE